MKKKQLKEFYFHGVSYYAHDENEVYQRYKKDHVVQNGEILHIGNKFFRVVGDKLHQLIKGK